MFFLLCGFSKPAFAEISQPKVLILNSYHQGEAWSDNEIAGILASLKKVYPFLTPSVEHLDAKRFPGSKHLLFVEEYLKNKYQGKKFDLIITLDNFALDLMLKFGDDLFPNVPIVFAGVNGYRPHMLKGHANITGVAEVQDMAGTIDLALKLHPDTKTILAVHDYTSSGLAVHRDMESAADRFKGKVTVKYMPEGTVDDLKAQLKALPPDAIVIILTYVTDKKGKVFTREESTRLITNASPVPIYAMHETRLGYGIVGGRLLEGREHGRQAAALALKILAGEDITLIPVENSRSRTIFDYLALARFKVPKKKWPADAVIINQPVSFWHQNRAILVSGLAIIAVLAIITVFLSSMLIRMRRAEGTLRENETFLQKLIDAIPMPIFYKDRNGKYVGINKSLETFFGKKRELIIGKSVFDIHPPELAERYHQQDTKLFSNGGIQSYDSQIKNAQGELRDIIFNKAVFTDSKGNPAGLIGAIVDITERKRGERYNQTLVEMLDAAPSAITIHDFEGRFLYANQKTFGMHGYEKEEFMALNLHDVDAPESEAFIKKRMQIIAEKGETSFNATHIRKDGSTVPLEVFVKKVDWETRPVMLSVATDISERLRAEKNIHDMAERLSLATRAARLGIWDWDIENNQLMWDDGMYPLYGIEKEEFTNTYESWLNGLHPEDRLENDRISEQARRGEREYDTEFRVVWPDGTIRHIKAFGQVVWDSDGNPIRMIGVNYDITEKKEMETLIQQAQKMEAIGNLAGGIAHDFNNILFPIIGMSEILIEDLPPDSPERENVEQIYRAGQRGSDLVKQILAFSRQSEHKMIPTRLQNILEEVIKLSRSTIPAYIEIDQETFSKIVVWSWLIHPKFIKSA
jgi:two-component system cell cycle sensor histidine kinase/response regulator CckA